MTATNNQALYMAFNGGSEFNYIQRTNADAPEIPGVLIKEFKGAALPHQPGVNQPHGPVFMATLNSGATAVNGTNNSALFAMGSDSLVHKLARTGDTVFGKQLKSIGAFSYVPGSPAQERASTNATHVIYRATFTDHSQALVEVEVP